MSRALMLIGWMGLAACGGKKDSPRAADSRSPTRLKRDAERCFDQGRYDCAMETFRKALKRKPENPDLLNRFAVAARLRYYVTGEADYRDQELVALRKAAKAAPRHTSIQVNFGTTCWEMGLRREASQAYQRALALEPSHPDAALMRDRIKRATTQVEQEEEP